MTQEQTINPTAPPPPPPQTHTHTPPLKKNNNKEQQQQQKVFKWKYPPQNIDFYIYELSLNRMNE